MSKPQMQRGYVYQSGNAFHVRFYAHENGVRKQRSHRLCEKNDLYPSKESPAVLQLCQDFMLTINSANIANDEQPFHCCPICTNRCKRTLQGRFASL